MKIKIKEGGPPGRRPLPSKKVTYFKTAACLAVIRAGGRREGARGH